MDRETETYSRRIRSLVSRVCDATDGLTEAQLNWRPPAEGANSVHVIAVHTLGAVRAWVLGIACGLPVGRDRPAEFAPASPAGDLVEAGQRLAQEIEAALAGLPPDALERRLVPDAALWGEGTPGEISARQALASAAEHLAIHLGHLHLTRDLALAATA